MNEPEGLVSGGGSYAKSGTVIVLEFDQAAMLDYFAQRAAHTKSGVTKFQDGLITARVLSTSLPKVGAR